MDSRRHLLKTLTALVLVSAGTCGAQSFGCGEWAEWKVFKEKFIQADGRVIDFAANDHSTSEGQAYALFFAVVADDRPTFKRLLEWTRANLAAGDLTARLMAWRWGKREDGHWGVIDGNAASDADLWLSYVLFQAARRWHDPGLSALAELVLERIARELVIDVAGLGPVLLPGPTGFGLQSGGWRLNPSYLPVQVLRALASEVPRGPWAELARTTVLVVEGATPQLLVPDWVAVTSRGSIEPDTARGSIGSYDAIRAYLWAGMLSSQDPDRQRLLGRMKGMATLLDRQLIPPTKVDAVSGRFEGAAPPGFSAALLPYLDAVGATAAARRQRQRVLAMGGMPMVYYEQMLGLFGLGWMDRRFRFSVDGRLDWGVATTCRN